MATIIRVTDRLLRSLPPGDYELDDPRLGGRGRVWLDRGEAVIISTDEPEPVQADEPDIIEAHKPRRKRKD